MTQLVWLVPALLALSLYGVGQGFVKKYIADVAPARFCLFFVVAKSVVNIGYYLVTDHPAPLSGEAPAFWALGIFAYVLDGLGWIFYFRSILLGPITIVGTLSAAYPALTVLFAAIFLGERLLPAQYTGVAMVIAGCVMLSYSPAGSSQKPTDRAWIGLAATALVLWGSAQTIVKYAYGFDGAHDSFMALCNTVGGGLTLGTYGLLYGRRAAGTASTSERAREWSRSFLPMSMMAGGDLGVIVASRYGPISIVTPLTGAYPIVTIAFAAIVLRETVHLLHYMGIAAVLIGMYLAT
jgi:drug/metabolite transporter (DMT)-like permease